MSPNIQTIDDIKKKEAEARALVKKKARTSSIAAVLPIPFLDIGTDMKLMNSITDEIEEIFGINHKDVVETKDDMTMRAAVMATSMGSEFVAKKVTPFLFSKLVKSTKLRKFRVINIAGLLVGAAVSYILMQKLGDNHVDKCVKYLKEEISE